MDDTESDPEEYGNKNKQKRALDRTQGTSVMRKAQAKLKGPKCKSKSRRKRNQ